MAVKSTLEEMGLYHGQRSVEEEILVSPFRDLVTVKKTNEINRDPGQTNLRKPFLIVNLENVSSPGVVGPNVAFSANVNMDACDNKVQYLLSLVQLSIRLKISSSE